MKNQNTMNKILGGTASMLALLVLLGWGATGVQGQTVQIRYRPLTPQEIKNAGLTNTTQKSTGSANTGLGQPIYLEALVQTGTIVNAVNWSILSGPPGYTSTITASPLSNAIPTYDGGDRIGLFVAGRAVLKPDKASYYDFGINDIISYKIKTDIVLTNTTKSYTNTAYGSTYIGRENYLCLLCHADKQALFTNTAHATAFADNITGVSSNHFSANCISCHTLGYDTTPGVTNGGFDDVAASIGWTFPGSSNPTNWSGMNTNLQRMANVQCEGCHGPASTHMTALGNTNAIDISLSAGTCGNCHDSLTHHVKNYEWGQALHATGFVFRFSGSCVPCHSSVGFIETWDPYYFPSNKVPRATAQEGIACAACHDPHTTGMGESQLRNIPTATLSNGVVLTYAEAGEGILCINCHHARQNAQATADGTGSISPHHSTQGDLLAGQNGYEYGLTMPSSRHMLAVTNSCVGCHMQLIAGTTFSNLDTIVGGHTWRIQWDYNTTNTDDDVQVTEVCGKCHVENTFDIVAEDYDRDGIVTGVQTEIQGLLDQLALLLPPAGTGVTYTSGYTPKERKGFWNYQFIWEDKSHGVHNPKYAAAILRASIDDLTGGIDVDQDGLTDAWEMAKFGSLTAQIGTGDADGDGVNNALEEQMGTNPNLADSDADGAGDLAELQGNSNPTNNLSFPPTNEVMVLPAYELAILPSTAGQTQVFQSVNIMGDSGTWSNVGPSIVSSNAMSFQLISIRDATQKYYRVIKP